MSKQAVTLLDQYDPNAVPAHLADFGDDSNIQPKQTVPTLSYEGKVWTVILNGEKQRLTRRNEDGEKEPLQTFKGVILNYNQKRGRTYYEGAYDPNKPAMPLCWSDDGIKPHEAVENPVSPKCDGCPMSIKGSKQTEQGKATTACSQHRMLVVVPASKLDFQPLRMKLAITSDWDSQSPDLAQQGWFAFQQYLDHFRAKKVPHTAMVVTKFKFDPGTAFPKVLFSPDRWLNEEETAQVRSIWKSEEVLSLLGGSWTPNGGDGTKAEVPAPAAPKAAPKAAAPAAAPKAAKPAPKPAPEPAEDDGEEMDLSGMEDGEEAPAPAPKPTKATAAPKATKAAPKAAPAPAEDDGEDMEIPEMLDRRSPAVKAAAAKEKTKAPPPPADDDGEFTMEDDEAPPPARAAKGSPAKPAAKKAPATEAPGDLDDLLGEWAGS